MYQQPPPNGPYEGAQPLIPPPTNMGPGQPMPPIAQPIPVAQPVPAPQPYGQPPVQNQPIVVNQYVPYAPVKFKTSPVSMVCPFCKNNITTLVDTQFNCCNC